MKPVSIAMAPTAPLLPYANSARTHPAKQIGKLCASLREFGFINPGLIDGPGDCSQKARPAGSADHPGRPPQRRAKTGLYHRR